MIYKVSKYCVWNISYSQLQRSPILNKSSYVYSYGLFNFTWFRYFYLIHRNVSFHTKINFTHVDGTISLCTRDIWIYLCNNYFCFFYCWKRNINRYAQRTISMFIWRRNLYKGYIQWNDTSAE